MKTLNDEVRAKFSAQLRQRTRQQPIESVTPTESYPGSEAKILALAARLARATALERELPLHHPADAKLPLGMAWRIRVGPNGRIIDKRLANKEEARIVLVAVEVTETLLDQIAKDFGVKPWEIVHELPPVPGRAA